MSFQYLFCLCKFLLMSNVQAESPMSAPQSIHRVAAAAFWRTFHHDGKICPGWSGWGCTATPFSIYLLFTITYKVAVYALAERADTFPLFHLYPYVLCGPPPQIKPSEWYSFRSKVIKGLLRLFKDPDSKRYHIQ
jgi:hypothetical protein